MAGQSPFEVATVIPPGLDPLKASYEADQVEADLKAAFIEVFEEMIRGRERRINTYGLPHRGDFITVERFVKQEGLALERRTDREAYMRELFRGWRARNPKRGTQFLRYYLQLLFPGEWTLQQMWHTPADTYPEGASSTPGPGRILTSRLKLGLALEDVSLVDAVISSFRSVLAARFVLETTILLRLDSTMRMASAVDFAEVVVASFTAELPNPSFSLTAPSPASGFVGAAATGGVITLENGIGPVSFTLTSAPAATLSPASGTISPGTPIPYTITASAAAPHSIELSNGAGIANPPAVAYTAAIAPPLAPSIGATTGITFSGATITWADNSSDETGFRVQLETPSGAANWADAVGATNPTAAGAVSFVASGLAASTQYRPRVASEGAGGPSAWSTGTAFTTPAAPPPPSLTLTAPSPETGTVGVAAGGGAITLNDGTGPVSFSLDSTPAATMSPASGTVNPGTPVPYTITALSAAVHSIALTNGAGIANPPAVTFTASGPPPPPPPPAPDPNFSSVGLLMHMDGAEGSTTFVDSSNAPLTPSAVGDAKITTAQSRFGGASAILDGTGDSILVSSTTPTKLSLSGQDFTIEMFCRRNTATAGYLYYNVNTGNSNGLFLLLQADGRLSFSGSTFFVSSPVGTVPLATWLHIAASWQNSGSVLRLFVEGTLVLTNSGQAITFPSSSAPIRIGTTNTGAAPFNGGVDEARVTRGVARYTAAFTAPTAPFADS